MSLAFVPVYVRYLGVESYGLIGVFALLQAWLVLLEMGMRPTLIREMARFTSGARDVESVLDLLRTFEIVGVALGAVVAFVFWLSSEWFAIHWVKAEGIPTAAVAQAFALMGGVAGLKLMEGVYLSAISGLQRQVVENSLTSAMAVVRAAGALIILAFISPTVQAFFAWQVFVSLTTVIILRAAVYRVLPSSQRRARFSAVVIKEIWSFAAGMSLITFLALLLTQVDKIILSKILSLQTFGYYALAGSVANALYLLTGPVTAAYYPRFTELSTVDNNTQLRVGYHEASQLISILVGSAAILLIVNARTALIIWTNDPQLVEQVAPLLAVIAFGTLLHSLMWVPYHLQLAFGWTSMTMKVNAAAVAILVPAIFWIVPRFGAIGAAWIWVALNSIYLVVVINLMHRRLMIGEKLRWYLQDVLLPLGVAVIVALICRWLVPDFSTMLARFLGLALSSTAVVLAAATATPLARGYIRRNLLPFPVVAELKN